LRCKRGFCNNEDIVSKTVSTTSLGAYRLRVASRALAAIGGGYALATACAVAGALGFQHLGLGRSDATMAASMLSFIAFAVVAMWCFGCATVQRAWLGWAVPTLLLAALAWLLQSGAQA
jgi:hypothetical protein